MLRNYWLDRIETQEKVKELKKQEEYVRRVYGMITSKKFKKWSTT